MDKELNNIADDIIKDSFGSAAPAAPTSPKPVTRKPSAAAPARPVQTSGDPFASRPRPAATPRETFTAEIPKRPASRIPRKEDPRSVSKKEVPKTHTNEYSRIKEQMSAAREASNLSPQAPGIVSVNPDNMPKQGLNKIILLFIILIPVVVVAAGATIAFLNRPEPSDNNSQQDVEPEPEVYIEPHDDAAKIDLSTYTSEIQITEPGKYVLSGTTNFPITINAEGEVTIYLNNVSVTTTGASALSNLSANILTIRMEKDSKNKLAVTDSDSFDSIFSGGDLSIDSSLGTLDIAGVKVADGHHYGFSGNGLKDAKNDTTVSEPQPESQEAPSEAPETQTDNSTAQPAEGETVLQPVSPSEPAAPAEPEQPATTR